MNRDVHGEIGKVFRMITYAEPEEDSGFMKELSGALFIPHTHSNLLL
jgi:hypothetical protein